MGVKTVEKQNTSTWVIAFSIEKNLAEYSEIGLSHMCEPGRYFFQRNPLISYEFFVLTNKLMKLFSMFRVKSNNARLELFTSNCLG